jgi:hypothetical protein
VPVPVFSPADGYFLRFIKKPNRQIDNFPQMPTFLFRCPNKNLRVQGWTAEEVSEEDNSTYAAVACAACRQMHYVNPATGRVLGAVDGDE